MKKLIVSIVTLVLAAGMQSAFAQSTAISSVSEQNRVQTTQVQTKQSTTFTGSSVDQKPNSVQPVAKTSNKETVSSVSEVKGTPVSKVSVNKVVTTSAKQSSSVD